MSYNAMSEIGKAVAEAIECHYYVKYLQIMAGRLDDYEVPEKVIEFSETKLEALPPDARVAVDCFLAPPVAKSMGHGIYNRRPWGEWMQQHLKSNPADLREFHTLEAAFTEPDLNEGIDWQMEKHYA